MDTINICQPEYEALAGMKEFYHRVRMLPTSIVADTALIRSHIAYWSGQDRACRVTIRPSRGHSYRVILGRQDRGIIVKITNYYDHREGVTGYR